MHIVYYMLYIGIIDFDGQFRKWKHKNWAHSGDHFIKTKHIPEQQILIASTHNKLETATPFITLSTSHATQLNSHVALKELNSFFTSHLAQCNLKQVTLVRQCGKGSTMK